MGSRRAGGGRQRLPQVEELAVAAAELAEDAQRRRPEGVRVRQQLLGEREQQLAHHRREERRKEGGVEVVDPELERAQRERDELLRGAQRVQHGAHEHMQVRQQRREPCG